MMRLFPGEEWKEITFQDFTPKLRYAISNYGRMVSYTTDLFEGRIRKPGVTEGFHCYGFKSQKNNVIKNKSKYAHRLVAQYFVTPQSEEHAFIIHLDFVKINNFYKNLKWVTKAEWIEHYKKHPSIIAKPMKTLTTQQAKGLKLTDTQVMRIKKKIFDPNRKTRYKMIAKEFGISEMQVYRIKTGENWGHIKI